MRRWVNVAVARGGVRRDEGVRRLAGAGEGQRLYGGGQRASVLALGASLFSTAQRHTTVTLRRAIPQEDLERVRVAGRGRVDITVGSALDIFGGQLPYSDVVDWHRRQQQH